MTTQLADLEQIVLNQHASASDASKLPLVFILGSPRTGSTLLYQLMINAFEVFYISNFINDHLATYPALGAALDVQLNPQSAIPYQSSYGKTASLHEPSEGSHVFRNWFGGEHPSQSKSATTLPDKRDHMLHSFAAIHSLTGRPAILKNAWNCFRIKELSKLFPKSVFIWIRRDIKAAAISDLKARKHFGSDQKWNSATPNNYKRIQTLPPYKQVVEQQYEFNTAIQDDIWAHASGRHIELWYEDLCDNLAEQLDHLKMFLTSKYTNLSSKPTPTVELERKQHQENLDEDSKRIISYVDELIKTKFAGHVHHESQHSS